MILAVSAVSANWSGQGESNSAIFSLEGCWWPHHLSTRIGIPQETRTLTNGFGDRRAAITLGRNKLVRPERLELPTAWFVAKCSNPLSYGRIYSGGDSWIRANDLLRMKQLHYRCAISPYNWYQRSDSNTLKNANLALKGL